MLIVAGHQPAYMPWAGYMEKLDSCHAFIYEEGVQFEKYGFQNRQRVRSSSNPQGWKWLTIPVVHAGSFQLIEEVVISAKPWVASHLGSVKAEHTFGANTYHLWLEFKEMMDASERFTQLSELLYYQTLWWIDKLGVSGPTFFRTSQMRTERRSHTQNGYIVAQLEEIADVYDIPVSDIVYLSGPSGRKYLELELFEGRGIEVEWLEPPQLEEGRTWLGAVDSWLDGKGLVHASA